ncbi:hypothetical protein [Martelella endophytica]|uniref:Holin n=1 Tax=Martelella endophytica TaxID=1486262 RepID=A0A0D5LTB8_MAREN|nr:hypothetical protein [Martelella endophytica]AJY47225.1 hypothetical protein TM49_18555 [Martelella endophytica]
MELTKKWYLSKTVWGALLAVAAPLLQYAGLHLDEGAQGELADSIIAILGAAGGLLAIIGRISAKASLVR